MNKTTYSIFLFLGRCRPLGLAVLITCFLAGCASSPSPSISSVEKFAPATPALEVVPVKAIPPASEIPVTRYNRYTLVEVGATENQQDLLNQIIDVTIPALTGQSTTVLDAMQYVLLNSGYRLCASESNAFHGFPLPLAHRQLGPITLKEALSILAGPGWQLQVDHQKRMVCFTSVQPESEIQQTDQEVQP